jgi:putrescine aminotransferase
MHYKERSEIVASHSNTPYVHFLKRIGLDIDVVAAEGAKVTDANGLCYLDCIAGYGNCFVGHNPRPIIDAVVAEIQSPRPFNLPFISEVQARLFRKLAEVAPGELDCCYAVNSGSEAVETALKLARLATGKAGVICATGAWHGFTFGCLSVSETSMTKQFIPFLEGVQRVPFGDAKAVDAAIDESIGCVIIEPIQAENGAIVPPPGYLEELRRICSRRKVLLIFDEAKTGIGKTGQMFACMCEEAVPDILVCGKALGGGIMPIGAIIARRGIWSRFGLSFPMSSSSGAGNAPACAAALATLHYVENEQLCRRALQQGLRLRTALENLVEAFPKTLLAIDGRGLLLSLQTASIQSASHLVAECVQRGLLIMTAFCDHTKILIEPPGCISNEEVDKVNAVLGEAVSACAG